MKIAIGADHAGYEYKELLKQELESQGYILTDFGTDGPESVDYPDYKHPLADDLLKGETELGIIICGSANGVAMTANKHQHIRAAIAWTPDIAKLARQHNNANVIALPARFISTYQAREIVDVFLNTEFEGGRHECRVNKISINTKASC